MRGKRLCQQWLAADLLFCCSFLNPKGVIPESAVAKAEGGMTSASKSNKGQTRAAEKGEQAADATEGKVDDGNLTDNEDDELLRSGKLNEELEG